MMGFRRLDLVLILSLVGGMHVPLAQTSGEPQRPTFAGTWKPSDPAKSESLFNVGIGWVPGDGRVVIEQTTNRLTVRLVIPDDKLDRLLSIQREFYTTVIYRIDDPVGRVGGAGGAGANGQAAGSSWQGDRLVLVQRQAGIRSITVAVSLDGDRLKLDSTAVVEGKAHTNSQWFDRIK